MLNGFGEGGGGGGEGPETETHIMENEASTKLLYSVYINLNAYLLMSAMPDQHYPSIGSMCCVYSDSGLNTLNTGVDLSRHSVFY